MNVKEEFDNLVEKLKTERDEIKVKMHLASMEAKEEFSEEEVKWQQVKVKMAEIADDAVDTSEEYIAKAKIVGDELKDTYSRIIKRFSECATRGSSRRTAAAALSGSAAACRRARPVWPAWARSAPAGRRSVLAAPSPAAPAPARRAGR